MISRAMNALRQPAPPVDPAARWRRLGAALLWYFLPAVAVAGVVGYMGLAVLWHANPPVVPVVGTSMRPAFHAGDVVFLKGVEPGVLRKGDVIGFRVPEETQNKYDLPPTYVHRIISREKGGRGWEYKTKGDAVSGPDPFVVPESDVVGRVVARGPGFGYPILFFRSRQGQIFAGALALITLVYFLLGFWDRRQEFAERNALNLAAMVDEARELKSSMTVAAGGARAPPVAAVVQPPRAIPVEEAGPEHEALPRCSRGCHVLPEGTKFDPHTGEPVVRPEVAAELEGEIPAARRSLHLAEFQLAPTYREPDEAPPVAPAPRAEGTIDFSALEQELHRAVRSNGDVQDTMRELVSVVGEYGEHLRSHTEVMKNLAATTAELQQATNEMRLAITGQAQQPPAAPPPAELPAVFDRLHGDMLLEQAWLGAGRASRRLEEVRRRLRLR